MKRLILSIAVILLSVTCTQSRADDTTKSVTYADARLSNGIVSVVFDPQGAFSIHDAQSEEVLLSDARFALPWGRRGSVEKMYVEDVRDALGVGKRVVLEWFNPECPYTRYCHMEGSLKGMSADWTPKGVVWLTINSSAPGLEGHGRDMNGGFKSKYRISNDLLLDESGEVGKAYGAKRTPQVFLIDEKGIVVYMGAVDNMPMGSLLDGQTEEVNLLERALQDLEAGRPVATPKTRAFGCSVRYAKSGG